MLFVDTPPIFAKKPLVLSPPHEVLYGDGSYSFSHHESMRKFDDMFDDDRRRKTSHLCPLCSIIRNQIVPSVRVRVYLACVGLANVFFNECTLLQEPRKTFFQKNSLCMSLASLSLSKCEHGVLISSILSECHFTKQTLADVYFFGFSSDDEILLITFQSNGTKPDTA